MAKISQCSEGIEYDLGCDSVNLNERDGRTGFREQVQFPWVSTDEPHAFTCRDIAAIRAAFDNHFVEQEDHVILVKPTSGGNVHLGIYDVKSLLSSGQLAF